MLSRSDGLVRAGELRHVTFRGITLEASRGTAVAIAGGAGCQVVGCTIRNVGGRAVQVDGGSNHEVFGCDVYFTGTGGIFLNGGDRAALTPSGHRAREQPRPPLRAAEAHLPVRHQHLGRRRAHLPQPDPRRPPHGAVGGGQRPRRRVQRDPQRRVRKPRCRRLLRRPRFHPARHGAELQLLAPDPRGGRARRHDDLSRRPAERPPHPRQSLRERDQRRLHRRRRRQHGDQQRLHRLLDRGPSRQPRHGLAEGDGPGHLVDLPQGAAGGAVQER